MTEQKNNNGITHFGNQLKTKPIFIIGEIVLVFLAAFVLITLAKPWAGDNPILKQAVVWFANVLMLLIVWAGLRLRGQGFKDFGLGFKKISWRKGFRVFLLSLVVFVIALVGYMLGSIIMVNITGMPEQADMSSYDFLKDNFGMLLLTLLGVYIVSSFGEEVIYRAFLINRISDIGKNTKTATIIALILSSVIYGLVHFDWGPMGIVQTAFMGLGLGICYLWFKKKLWILVLAHAYMDTILMVQMYLANN